MLHTAPIHALEANKAMWEGDWEVYDMRRLQMAAIETTLDHQGLEGGITRTSLKEEVATVAAGMAPDRPREQHLDAAERVLFHLLNEAPGSDFLYPYQEKAETGFWQRRLHAVKVLDQRQAEDGLLVVRASPEAINLLIGALDVDIADAQKAEERLLDQYIREGKLDEAQASAERARLRSVQYLSHITDFLRIIRQDISRLDWSGEVLDEIRSASQHLEERAREEATMREMLLLKLDTVAEPEQRQVVLNLVSVIMDCHRRHRSLHGLLMRAEEEIPAEQLRQRFAPPASITSISMGGDVLDPLLLLPRTSALEVADGFFERLLGVRSPEMMDLFQLFDALLAPRREFSEEESEVGDLDLEDQSAYGSFSSDAVLAARSILESTRVRSVRVSELLRAARQSPIDRDQVLDLVRLSALWAFAPEQVSHPELGAVPDGMRSLRDGSTLSDPEYAGDDLLVDSRPVVEVGADG
jgi:hypothetical protein